MSDAPLCCGEPARLTTGAEVYPRYHDLHHKNFYKCDRCKRYCGCHPGTTKSLGIPADAETRRARSLLHDQFIDPIWKPQAQRKKARGKVYAFMALVLGIPRADCHTGMFSIEQCRQVARAVKRKTYQDIERALAEQKEKSAANNEPRHASAD